MEWFGMMMMMVLWENLSIYLMPNGHLHWVFYALSLCVSPYHIYHTQSILYTYKAIIPYDSIVLKKTTTTKHLEIFGKH